MDQMSTDYAVEFTLSDQDIRDSILMLPQMRLYQGVGALVLALTPVWAIASAGVTTTTLVYVLSGVVFGCIFVLLPRFVAQVSIRRYPANARDLSVRLKGDGYVVKNSLAESRLRWELVPFTVEGDHGFLIMLSNKSGHYLPRRVFDPQVQQEVRELLRAKVPRRGLRLPGSTFLLWFALVLALVSIGFMLGGEHFLRG